MRVVSVRYERTFNLGNYESEKIGIEIELDSNDQVQKALNDAKKFVELNREKVTGNGQRVY